MNNLSQECAEKIKQECGSVANYALFMLGCKAALTNPTIYQSAGLIKAQDILPETFKTEAVNTILVNALRYLNDEQTSQLLKAICERKKDAALAAGLMTVDEALRFAEWFDNLSSWDNYRVKSTTDLLTIFRNQNK